MSRFPAGKEPICGTCHQNKILQRGSKTCKRCAESPGWFGLAEDEDHPRGMPFEREWAVWMREIGMAKDRYAGPNRRAAQTGRLKVVTAGDFHIPFHDKAAVAELVARESQADVLVIGGDFGDAHAASTFTKYDYVSFLEEFAGQTAVLQTLSETFPRVVYLRGSNHPDRYEKRLRERLDKDLVDAVMAMTGGILAPDLVFVKRFPNVELGSWKTPDGQDVNWLTVLGDVAFCHAEKYSRVPGATLRGVEEWLTDFRGALGLPPIRAVVQFHTHAQALLPWKSDAILIEPGAMCASQGYQMRSKIGGRPQRVGYTTFDLVDGRIDYDSIRMRWLNRPSEINVA